MVDSYDIARVQMWGSLVGALAYDRSSGLATFEYSDEWLRGGVDISPAHMPLSKKRFQFPALPRETFNGLPPAFADSLPDDFGNAVINAWLSRQGRSAESFTALERLLYTGTRGMGALEYLPMLDKDVDKTSAVQLDALLAMAQQVLDERAGLSAPIDTDARQDGLLEMLQVGTSAGGARPKAVIGINKQRTEIRCGQSELPAGFEHYVLKFDGVVESRRSEQTFGDPLGYGRMEYAYYLMAVDAGINMSHCELLDDGERAHFMTRRFEREGNEKLHYQSLCAMDHADYKQPGHYSYEQIFMLMRQLRMTRPQALEMYRRMVFNIVARNQDDHTKNFGFVLRRGGSWALAPAFDIAFSYKPDSPWVSSHQLSLNGKRDNFTRDDLLMPAQTFRKEAAMIIEQVCDTVANWQRYANSAGVETGFANKIGASHRLTWGAA